MTDDVVLQREGVTIELAGKSYHWPEPTRRKARVMRAALIRVVQKLSGLDLEKLQAMDPDTVLDEETFGPDIMTLANDMLDFFYAHHEGMAEDQKHIDEHAEDDEIMKAWGQLTELLIGPFGKAQDAPAERND